MPLSQQQRQMVIEALQKRNLPGSCQVCKHNSWVLDEHITYISLSEPGGPFTIGGPSMPCVPLVCGNCGNTLLFNLVVLGVWETLLKK